MYILGCERGAIRSVKGFSDQRHIRAGMIRCLRRVNNGAGAGPNRPVDAAQGGQEVDVGS